MRNEGPHTIDGILAFAVILVAVLAWLVIPETIPAGGGFGYDGKLYAQMVMDIERMLGQQQLSGYYAQRILPSMAVRALLALADAPLHAENVIWGFRVLNIALLCVCMLFWIDVARRLHLPRISFWLGVSGLFLCFPNAKLFLYSPVLTDTFGFCIGCGLMWAYVLRNPYVIACIAAIGAFAWQMSAPVGAILILSLAFCFASQESPALTSTLSARPKPVRRAFYVSIPLASVILALMAGFAIAFSPVSAADVQIEGVAINPAHRLLTNFPMLLLITVALVYCAERLLHLRLSRKQSTSRLIVIFALALLLLLMPSLIARGLGNPSVMDISSPRIETFVDLLSAWALERVPEGKFFLPIVAHFVYFGPVSLLVLLLWPAMADSARALGPGFVVLLMLAALMLVFSESRFSIMLWPFVVAIVSVVIKDRPLSVSAAAVFFGFAVFLSKFWLVMNQGPWPMPDSAMLFSWPKSLYFSHFGPWMNWSFYYTYGALALAALLTLAWLMRKDLMALYR